MEKRHTQAVVLVLLVGAVLLGPWVPPFIHRHQYRAEVRMLYEHLHLGMTKEQVRREMDQSKYPDLDFFQEGDLWLGEAPLELGAGNWVLRVEFQDDSVSAVRVRIADGAEFHPQGAPADKARSR